MLELGRENQFEFQRAHRKVPGLAWAASPLLLVLFLAAGCTANLVGIPTGAVVGRPLVYDYSPTVIQNGNLRQFWWCGEASNPNNASQQSDAILYATIVFDTNSTGYESNFIASFLRDPYGNLNTGSYPTIEVFTSFSNPQPGWDASPRNAGGDATPDDWDIGEASWTPSQPLLPLMQYYNNKVHEATTGWIDPKGRFALDSTVGALFEAPQNGAALAFYGCKSGSQDYFISTDSACEGQRTLGVQGYGYAQSKPGLSLQPLYRYSSGHDHFVSTAENCDGQSVLLGYIMRQ